MTTYSSKVLRPIAVLALIGCGSDEGVGGFAVGRVATLELFIGTVGLPPGETITLSSGSLLPGEEESRAILRMINTGQTDLNISQIALESDPPDSYRLAATATSREPLIPGPYTIVPQTASAGQSSLAMHLIVRRPDRGTVPTGRLLIRSNSVLGAVSQPEIIHPLALEVFPPKLLVVPENVDFGSVLLGDRVQASLTLDNRGGDILLIGAIQFTGTDGFGLSLGPHAIYSTGAVQRVELELPMEIAPGEQASAALEYTALVREAAEAQLLFFSNDPTATRGVAVSVVANEGVPRSPVVELDAPEGAAGPITCKLIEQAGNLDALTYSWYWRVGDGQSFTTFGPTLDTNAVRDCDKLACWTEASNGEETVSSNIDAEVLQFGPDCVDGNPCTDDGCGVDGGCSAINNVAPCPDDDLCNGAEACQDGRCSSGAPVSCSDVSACLMQQCNPATGRCDLAKPDETPCPDADLCNGSETCRAGVCVAGIATECSTVTSMCTQAICNPTTGLCDLPAPDNSPCADDDLCDGNEVCMSGVCTPGTRVSCSEIAEPCLEKLCNPSTGRCDSKVADGTPCPDADECNGEETCKDGQCVSGTPILCGDPCGVFGVPCPTTFNRTVANTCENSTTGEIWVPAGAFWMGCNTTLDKDCIPNEFEQHKVNLSPYAIDAQHVTAQEYLACVEAGACTVPANGDAVYATYRVAAKQDHPINYVTWNQAKAYCEWGGKTAGVQRLCSEAEWERAARGGCETVDGDCSTSMRTYPWGEDAPDCSYANIYHSGAYCQPVTYTAPVGSTGLGDSCYGLQDAAGNVMQWVADWYEPTYSALEVTDPPGPAGPNDTVGHARVTRGGSLYSTASVRASVRSYGDPDGGVGYFLGIRCCRDVP